MHVVEHIHSIAIHLRMGLGEETSIEHFDQVGTEHFTLALV